MEPLVGVDAFVQQLEFTFGVRSVQRSQSADVALSQNACKPYVTVNAIFLYFFFSIWPQNIEQIVSGHLHILPFKPKNRLIQRAYVLFNDGVMHLHFAPAPPAFSNPFVPPQGYCY